MRNVGSWRNTAERSTVGWKGGGWEPVQRHTTYPMPWSSRQTLSSHQVRFISNNISDVIIEGTLDAN